MNGYSGHKFMLINYEDEITYIQIHCLVDGGFDSLSYKEGKELIGSSPEYTTKDLYDRISLFLLHSNDDT